MTRNIEALLPPYRIRPLTQSEGGGYLIEFEDFPGCIADGETPEEAKARGSTRCNPIGKRYPNLGGSSDMFILSLTYIAPLEEADRHMEAHMAWLRDGYDGNFFLASGRKIPRTGGVILARGERATIEELCAADPFVIHKIAEYEIIEVAFTTVAAGIEILKA